MLGAYKKLEYDPLYNDPKYTKFHGNNKDMIPIHRIEVNDWGPVAKAMKSGCMDTLGWEFTLDLNHPDSTGVSPFPMNMKKCDGKLVRVSTNDAYLDPARTLSSDGLLNHELTVQSDMLVNRVVFDKDGTRAVGVEVCDQRGGKTVVFCASREIILAAGALYTPAILQRSGVGPKHVLDKFNIPIVKDCGIGIGLQDHPVINGKIVLKDSYDISKRHANALARFTSTIGPNDCFNDLYFVSVEQGNDPRAQQKPGDIDDGSDLLPVGYIDVMLMKCNSRGSVEIQSTDPVVSPSVNENMLSDPLDRERMRYGVRKLIDLFKSPSLQNIVRKSEDGEAMIQLGRANDGLGMTMSEVLGMSNEQLDAWMVSTLSDGIHICSSCPMGNKPSDVVDSDGNVKGLSGLRICDASIFPTVPRANTHLTAIATAEIISDKIIHGLKSELSSTPLSISRLHKKSHLSLEIATLLLNEWPSENDNENDPRKLAEELLARDKIGLDAAKNVDNYMITWVATFGNSLAGTIRFCSHDMEGNDKAFGNCWIAALYVKDQYRKQNLGKKLVQTVMQFKAETFSSRSQNLDGGKKLHLWFPMAKAHLKKFYESSGFVALDEKFTFAKSSFGEEVVVMRLQEEVAP